MHGAILDVLLLVLLSLFFGSQQRRRPELYYRFWVAGWLLLLGSYTVWEIGQLGLWHNVWREAVRFDLLLLSALAFAMSFMTRPERLKQTLALSCAIAVPSCFGVDLQIVQGLPPRTLQVLILLLLVVGHGAAIFAMELDLPPTWQGRRRMLMAFNVCIGLWMMVRVALNPGWYVGQYVLCEIFLFAGIFYAMLWGGSSLAGLVGAAGFVVWAVFYPVANMLNAHSYAQRVFFEFWDLPKYCVGFSMILRVAEESAEDKARLAEEYRSLYEDFRVLFERHPHAMWIYSPQSERFLAVNRAAEKVFGYSAAEFLQLGLHDLELPPDDEVEAMQRMLPDPPEGHRTRFRRKDGHTLWVNMYERPVVFQDGEAKMITARDVTQQLIFSREMAHRAHHDELTGLPTRAMLFERLEEGIAAGRQQSKRMALLAVDVDHFKQINDGYGHMTGDDCLKAVAERLRRRVRHMDMVARTGGEEFMAVVGGLSSEADAHKVAQQLLEAFEEPVRLPDCDLALTISIGIALYPDHGQDSETLRRMADMALYQAKREGRNCARVAKAA